ncbi:hypothetical protein SMICM304S_00464 [Streptomyces microflavus]
MARRQPVQRDPRVPARAHTGGSSPGTTAGAPGPHRTGLGLQTDVAPVGGGISPRYARHHPEPPPPRPTREHSQQYTQLRRRWTA